MRIERRKRTIDPRWNWAQKGRTRPEVQDSLDKQFGSENKNGKDRRIKTRIHPYSKRSVESVESRSGMLGHNFSVEDNRRTEKKGKNK